MSKSEEKKPVIKWHGHARYVPQAEDITLSIEKTAHGKEYRIQLCPTISLSLFSNQPEALKAWGGSNHKILGVLPVNSNEQFEDLWNAIFDVMQKHGKLFVKGN